VAFINKFHFTGSSSTITSCYRYWYCRRQTWSTVLWW